MSKAKTPIYARGKTLWFRINKNGQQIRKSTGFKVGQEDLAYQAYLDCVDELENISAGFIPNKTIDEGLVKWLEEYVPYLSGAKTYHSHVRAILPFSKGMPISEIYSVAYTLKKELLKQGKKPATINRKLSVLKRVATLANTEWKWLKESPYKKIVNLPENNERDVSLTHDEVQQISDHCHCELTKALVIFAAYTGLRTAEIRRLTKFSLKGNILHVDGKGNKKRFIPLHPPEVEFIEKHIPIKFCEGYIKRNFRSAADMAGLNHVKFHDLRHTFGTWLAKEKTPLNRIMSLMGHTTVMMAQRYINMCVEDFQEDMPTPPKPKIKTPDLRLINLRD